MQTRAGPLLSVPYPMELNDAGSQAHRDHTGRQFAEMIVDQFEEMLEQSERQPLVCALALHGFIVGQPFRLRPGSAGHPALRRAQAKDGSGTRAPATSRNTASRSPRETDSRQLTNRGFAHTLSGTTYTFPDLKSLLAKASPRRSGDELAGIAAASSAERVAAQMALADVPLTAFLNDAVVPYEARRGHAAHRRQHNRAPLSPSPASQWASSGTGCCSEEAADRTLRRLAPGLTPEMAAAVCKIMRLQDLIAVAAKCRVTTAFRNTIGLPGRLSTRLQPNHPTDDPAGIAASIVDGLMYGAGDAVIGINPVTDSIEPSQPPHHAR